MHIPPACLTCGDPTIGAVGPAFLAWRQHVMASCTAAAGTHPARAMTDARLRPQCQEGLLADYGGLTPARRVRGVPKDDKGTKDSKSAKSTKRGAKSSAKSSAKKVPAEPSPEDTPAQRAAAIFPDETPLEPIFEALGIDSGCCRMCIGSAIVLEYVL